MKDDKLDRSLRAAKPAIQPEAAFTARVMERVDVSQAPRRRFGLSSIWLWTTTATAVFVVVAVFALSTNPKPDQVANNPIISQESGDTGSDLNNTDSGGSSSQAQLAKQVQEDIDAIDRGISSLDSTEYDDSGLSDIALYN